MIERLTIRNFQAHEKLTINLDPTVTCIVGRTDVGKSAVLRALRWLATNKPAGVEFVNWAATDAKVSLVVDGHTIKRSRGKGGNAYKLNGHLLKAFGDKVPEDVARLLNLNDINFQAQRDGPFWFSQSPGEVSRQLNQIIDLGIIDNVLAHLNAELRNTNATISVCTARLDEAKAEKRRLKQVKQKGRELRALEQHQAALDALGSQIQRLSTLTANVRKFGAIIAEAGKYAALAAKCLSVGDRWGLIAPQRDRLATLVDRAKQLETQRDLAGQAAAGAAKDYSKALKSLKVCPLCQSRLS